jgi:hypothetical protein
VTYIQGKSRQYKLIFKGSNVGFTRFRLPSSYYKHVQKLKETMYKELKENMATTFQEIESISKDRDFRIEK